MEVDCDISSLDDVRQILADVENRNANFDFDVVMLETDKRLRDISSLLGCISAEGCNSDYLKIRQLVDKNFKLVESEIKGNVEEKFQVIQSRKLAVSNPVISSTSISVSTSKEKTKTRKLLHPFSKSSRLLEKRSSTCDRCIKKQEKDSNSVKAIKLVHPQRQTVPATKVASSTAHSSLLPRATPIPLVPPPAEVNFLLPSTRTSLPKCSRRSQGPVQPFIPSVPKFPRFQPFDILSDNHHMVRSRLETKGRSASTNQVIIPLGLIQSNRVSVEQPIARHTIEPSSNVGMAMVNLEEMAPNRHSTSKALSIQRMPSIEIKSLHINGQFFGSSAVKSNMKYAEYQSQQMEEPVIISEVPGYLSGLHQTTLTEAKVNQVSYNGAASIEPKDDLVMARKIVEEELVDLFLAELDLQCGSANSNKNEDCDLGSFKGKLDEDVEKPPTEYTELEENVIGINKPSSPLLEPKLNKPTNDDHLLCTPISTPPPSLIPEVRIVMPRTPSPSVASQSPVVSRSDCQISLAEAPRMFTPTPTSKSSSLDPNISPPTPSELVCQLVEEEEKDEKSKSIRNLNSKHVLVSTRFVDEPVMIEMDTASSCSRHNQTEQEELSLGQVRLVPLQLLKSMQHYGSGRGRTPDDDSSAGADELELDQDFIDLTSSTTLSEGEIKYPPLSALQSDRLAMLKDYIQRRRVFAAGGDASQIMPPISKAVKLPHSDGQELSLGEAITGVSELGMKRFARTISAEEATMSLGETLGPSHTLTSSFREQTPSEGELQPLSD